MGLWTEKQDMASMKSEKPKVCLREILNATKDSLEYSKILSELDYELAHLRKPEMSIRRKVSFWAHSVFIRWIHWTSFTFLETSDFQDQNHLLRIFSIGYM